MASAGFAAAAIFPETWGMAKQSGESAPIVIEDKALAAELGFEAGARAAFAGPMGKFHAQAWRFKDPTSALVYYFAQRPEGFRPAPDAIGKAEPLALVAAKSLYLGHGNYILRFEGWVPSPLDLKALYHGLAKLDQSSLPSLPGYMPSEGLQAGSERYVIGPATLERYEGRIGAGTAAFSMGAEAVTADYGTAGRLSIFNYPTPDIARQRLEEFRKLAGSVAKRSGPLVAVVLGANDPDVAERLLAKVNYQASLTWNEPTQDAVVKEAGRMMLSIFALAGVLSALAVTTGVIFGLLRYARRRLSSTDVDEHMITLDLNN